ncbi:PP0621 family protein [Hydrogenophaga sp.]|uniref:PP0621 family protein n=1 Tax=Hydrogenophaga sp. TaxID=1904254 RepID=UPI0035656B23
MKYLLVLSVVLIAVYIWRNNRRSDQDEASRRRPSGKRLRPPDVMVACAHCGTHLPQAESVHGRAGVYCSSEHLQLHEGPHA